jgi:hypothetical protein
MAITSVSLAESRDNWLEAGQRRLAGFVSARSKSKPHARNPSTTMDAAQSVNNSGKKNNFLDIN